MTEKAKRLKPKPEILRELFLKSGNFCAFPNCGQLMMNAQGDFIGQVCHIEAAEEGGERFNAKMTNEQRRAARNLMLLCYEHHIETDNVNQFPVKKMRKYKEDHESRFSNPGHVIFHKIEDATKSNNPTYPKNLMRFDEVLGWGHGPEETEESLIEVKAYIERLRAIPTALRQFVGAVALRTHKMRTTHAVRTTIGSGERLLVDDILGALNISQTALVSFGKQLDAYGLGSVDEHDTNLGMQYFLELAELDSGWPFWSDLATFCDKVNVPMEAFTIDLDFGRLDT